MKQESIRFNQSARTLSSLAIALIFSIFVSACGGEKTAVGEKSGEQIRWRLQSYAGPALNEHVVKNAIDEFNTAANGEMVIEIYTADQLVPQGELFRAVQSGTVDLAVSDDSSMGSPADVAELSAYFPFATRYGIDIDVLWQHRGLNEIWKEAYDEIEGVTWLSQGSWDPCNFATKKPIRSLADLKGLRMYMFPTGGEFMKQFGVVPVTLPYEDVPSALQTGILDGVAWSGITEDYTVGWADVTKYYLTNPIAGGWAGGWFVHSESWEKLPKHLQTLLMLAIQKSHYYKLHWYWDGEARYRATGKKLTMTTIPADEWAVVEEAAYKYWDQVAKKSPRNAKVVKIIKEYAETMKKAGPPYRY
jgi:TRAP-type mannitol/chloroaromatic compound transport system substrate-binding protein